MKYVKLTDQKIQTFGGFQWEVGKKVETSGDGGLCGPGWLHCYGADTQAQAALLAVLLNPIHADFTAPRLWSIEVGGNQKKDNGIKFGFTEMTLIKEFPIPEISTEQRVRFGILCAMEVCSIPEWRRWAEKWLSGEDRTAMAAWGVMVDAGDAADAAVAAATGVAVDAADAAVDAADAATDAADAAVAAAADADKAWTAARTAARTTARTTATRAAWATWATWTTLTMADTERMTARTTWRAARAARAAATAAEAAVAATRERVNPLNLGLIAEKALGIKNE